MLSEKAIDTLTKINNYLPEWATFNVKQYNNIFQANITIESQYFKTFKIATESTCLENALDQILKMLEVYWVYKEDESPALDLLIEELKQENII
jgi:hypothetical protein